MKAETRRRLANWSIVVVLALATAGALALGVFREQMGDVLFNATLV